MNLTQTSTIKKVMILVITPGLFLASPALADYGYFTVPLLPPDSNGISSWFDHTSPLGSNDTSTVMTRYDGVVFTTSTSVGACSISIGNCYSGHSGVDFRTFGEEGKDILAAASGTVKQVQWLNPSDHSSGYGFFVRLWHNQYGLSTLYAHTTSSIQVVNVNDNITRGQKIAVSGCTGICLGAHLHFQIYNSDVTVSSTNSHFASSVDPYGWSGGGPDPWTKNRGYLWASLAATSSVYNYVTSTSLTTNTTWSANQIYVIDTNLTVNSGVILTIQQGVVVKFKDSLGYLQVNGQLRVNGTASKPVYFTSIKDDAVGGDMNDDATSTTPAAGDWWTIYMTSTASTTMNHTIIRYGGKAQTPYFAAVFNEAAKLTASNLTVSSSESTAVNFSSGTVSIVSSTLSAYSGSGYGILADNGGSLTIRDTAFTNSYTAGSINLTQGMVYTASGNTVSGNSRNGFNMLGTVNASQLWQDGIPYVLGNLTVPSGKTLTINSGVKVKFESAYSTLDVAGVLNAQGTAANKIYFTSIYDDVGGDTNGDTTSTSPAVGDWACLNLNTGASTTIKHAFVRYAGNGSGCANGSLFNEGNKLTISNSTIASSSLPGIWMATGTLSIVSSTLSNNSTGIVQTGGTVTGSHNNIRNNSTYGYNNTTNSTTTFERNYWNASSGPTHASNPLGSGQEVSDYVDFTPWATSSIP